MLFKSFARRQINGEQTEFIQFGPEHYKKAGIPYSPFAGMPILEAHQIVNELNRNRSDAFVYYLAA